MLKIAIEAASTAKRPFKWGEVVSSYKIYACSDAQLDILSSRAKYTFAFAGSGGGKTCLIPLWLFKQVNKHLEASQSKLKDFWRALVVSPTNRTFETSQLKQHLTQVFAGTALEGEWQESKKTYRLPQGLGEIVVVTAEDDPRRLSGGQYNAIVMDECWQMRSPEIWEEARRRSNICNAPILGVTTPNCDGWLLEEVYQPWERGEPDYYVRQWATSENPVHTPEQHAIFLDSELQKMGKAKFDRMYGGQFAQLSGLVYEAFRDKQSDLWPVIPTPHNLPSPAVRLFGSIDWGYHPDPTSVHIYAHCENDVVYACEEMYGTKIEIDQLGWKLKALQDKWSNRPSKYRDAIRGGFFDAFYCDSSRPEVRQLISRYGVSIRNRKIPLIEAGVAIVDQLFRAKRIKIFDCCTNLIREAQSYAWDKNKPKAGSDHAMDSMRYGLSSHFADRVITVNHEGGMADETEVEVAQRLGHAESKEDLEAKQRKAEEEKQAQWILHMMTADDPE